MRNHKPAGAVLRQRRRIEFRPIPVLIPVLLGLALVVASCGSATGDGGDTDDLRIVATTTIWADVVRNVVGDHGTVDSLMPVGADPHSFSPSPSQVASLVEADLVIANGLGLEAVFDDILDSAVEDGANVVFLGEHLDPIPFEDAEDICEISTDHDDHGEEDGHDDHDHAACDPHVWLDPLRVAAAAGEIAEALSTVDASTDWSTAADAYADELTMLELEMQSTLAAVPAERRVLVTNHESLGYFADRFGFTVAATVIPGGSTLGDPSSADLAELVETMRDLSMDVIFAETTESTVLADAVASELGTDVQVVELFTGSLGSDGSGAETLIGMLTTNAERIAGALG